MAKSVNEKYMEATESAFYDTRFDIVEFAIQISRHPVATQIHYFKMLMAYVDVLAGYVEKGFVPMGMRDIGFAAVDMKEIIDEYFPVDPNAQVIQHGVEFEQI
jgi:hypothetical protein